MGIKSSFNNFLRNECPQIFEEIHISEYAYKLIAIDISLYLNKYKAIAGDNWKALFLKLISSLRRNQIHCVFIFDGKSPPEKEEERKKRRNERQKIEKNVFDLEQSLEKYHQTQEVEQILLDLSNKKKSRLLSPKKPLFDINWIEDKIKQKRAQLYQIYPEDYDNVKKLFDILKVPYYTAPWEAEKMCAKLNIDGYVDAVLSEDTDLMAYNTPVFLSKIDTSKDTCIRIKKEFLLESLELDEKMFLDLCIMCGTDYNDNIPRIGSKTAYKHIKKFSNIENFAFNTGYEIEILKHLRVRELFCDFEDYNINKIPYCGQPNFIELEKFIKENKIYIDFVKIKNDFTLNILIFEDNQEEDKIIISDS
jgi:5'-3' exonuclease|tara:strand:+ start:587 stop:1678 length:1092 start_codon:yes stop_codon:yes gene_type:complete